MEYKHNEQKEETKTSREREIKIGLLLKRGKVKEERAEGTAEMFGTEEQPAAGWTQGRHCHPSS